MFSSHVFANGSVFLSQVIIIIIEGVGAALHMGMINRAGAQCKPNSNFV